MAQINKPTEHFNTKLYSGNGSTNSITGVGFKPDWVWMKGRSGTYATENHNAYDSTRGATKFLIPNGTTVNSTDANSLTSFDTDGFSMGVRGDINGASTEYLSWNWKANGGTTSSNTDGTITSTVQANTASGFSIVTYTGNGTSGATVGHGLSAIPGVLIVKRLDTTSNWQVYHHKISSNAETKYMFLNGTDAQLTATNRWNDTAPTTSVFSLGNSTEVNANNGNYVAYVFAEKKGYSKFGVYTGNASTNGTFVYTGFKPAWIVFKEKGNVNSWRYTDSVRDPFNPKEKAVNTPGSSAEANSGYTHDALSNGFKIRTTDTNLNRSGGNYIYMAFAEQPLVGTNNIPATAR